MIHRRSSYITTYDSSHLVMAGTTAVLGSGVTVMTLITGGVELIISGFLYFFNIWVLGLVGSYDVNHLGDYIGWFALVAVYTLSWAMLVKHMTAKRLIPTWLLLSFVVSVYSYGWLMETSAFDQDNWFIVGVICLIIFINCYIFSLEIVTTRSWQPDNLYYVIDDPSWAFLWQGGRFKTGLVSVAYMWLFFAVPILLALYTQHWIPESWKVLFLPALYSVELYQWLS